MPIQILPEQVASQIAAGEVVERPASVVKELVENAIDAGATNINVDVRAGGRQLIQVADNGSGISPAEIETAFMRHATSKLRSAEDLHAIHTLGFRGEALAAIAAVSKVTVVSKFQDEPDGIRLALAGGHLESRETVGAPQGTVIAVSNLFYNVPARLKFLKSEVSEKRHIDEFITRYALAYPEIRFRLSHNNRITFQTSGSGDLREVLAAIYGPEVARQLLEISLSAENDQESVGKPAERGEILVRGFVGPPSLNWANRTHIMIFTNGRWIRDNSLNYAVIQAYHTLLPTGRYPLGVVFIELPATEVDVNVHPAKTEVRFRRPNAVFGAVQRQVRAVVTADSPIPHGLHFSSLQSASWPTTDSGPVVARRDDDRGQTSLNLEWPVSPPESISTAGDSKEPAVGNLGGDRLPIMRVVGQVGAAYIVTEGPEGLYLIDQHAAHERILYEQFMADWQSNEEAGGIASQGLVSGVVVSLSPAQSSLLEDNLELLNRIGFNIEPFGPNTFVNRSVPAMLSRIDPAKALVDVVEELERGEAPLQNNIEARIILRVCKSAAVKAGQTLSHQEMEALIHQLEQCKSPHTCPHGRPTLIYLSVNQLAKEFGRT